jgi:outer membrane protein assembly factor BamD (BamD/ComL family)
MLNQINEQLAYKQFSIGRYYQKTGNKQAANFYYRMVIDNWPESTAAKMTNEILKDKGTTKNLRGENVKK